MNLSKNYSFNPADKITMGFIVPAAKTGIGYIIGQYLAKVA